MTIHTPNEWGDIMYIKTDPEQRPRQLVGITARPNGIQFCLAYNGTENWLWDIEVSKESDTLKILTEP